MASQTKDQRVASLDSQTAGSVGSEPGYFQPTAWSIVFQAQKEDDHGSRRYLELLVRRYWRPVYAFARQMLGNDDKAKDVTQGFFTTFIERRGLQYADPNRGKFRSFLIASVRRYMQKEHRARQARPSETPISEFDWGVEDGALFPAEDGDPARAFMKNWAKSIVETSLTRLRDESCAMGKEIQYRVFRRRCLDAPKETYAETARSIGVTEKDVANFLSRTKKRFARILRSEVRHSLLPQDDPDQEIQELLMALAG